MADFSKISPDNGQTILNAKDTNGRIMSEQLIRDTVGWTGKNKAPNYFDQHNVLTNGSLTTNNITFTLNADKTITINTNGQVSADTTVFILTNSDDFNVPDGNYIFSGNGSDGLGVIINRVKNGSPTNYGIDYGNPVTFTKTSTDGAIAIAIRVYKDYSFTNHVVKSMLRLATITDSTYEPYHDNVSTEITNIRDVMGKMGAKNLLNNILTTSSHNNVTYTVNSDKSVSLSGTTGSTVGSNKTLHEYTGAELKAFGSNLILSGGYSADIYLAIRTSNWDFIARSNGKDATLNTSNLEDNTTYYVTIGIEKNQNTDGITIYPMIRLASDTDNTYVPYAMTNKELTKICQKSVFTDITSAVNAKLGTQTYNIWKASMWEDEYRVDVCIWLNNVSGGNIDWDLSGVIPVSRGEKPGVIVPRGGNPSGLTWIGDNTAIICNRFATSVDATQSYCIEISYYKN